MGCFHIIYLDNSATTKPCGKAIEYMNKALCDNWGNPSSLHILGMNAEMAVDSARSCIAKFIGAANKEIIFTSCGTEANNTAIMSALHRKNRGNRIITTTIEHPSVLQAVNSLEKFGFEIIRLKPDGNGIISLCDLENALNDKTVLVSIMLVNNETGAIQPIKAAAQIIKEVGAPALLHCDGVQAFGKMPINLTELGVDLFSASGHKIHGPKGVGILYIKKGVTIKPLLTGGGQEKNMRSGTESVPLIYGLGGAIDSIGNINEKLKAQKELWSYAKNSLQSTGFVTINSTDDSLPYILNISVEGYRSETLLHFLEAQGIYVSSGSACAKGEGSYVLKEIGLSKNRIDSALRISFSRDNTKEDVDALKNALISATQKLRRSIK